MCDSPPRRLAHRCLIFLSYDIARQIPWKLLGTAFQGQTASLDWPGIPCEFGETTIDLLDPHGTIRVANCRLVDKFAKAQRSVLKKHLVLGLNFLVNNSIDFVSRSRAGTVNAVRTEP